MILVTDESGRFDSDSRRSFVKKSAIAASALALGASGTAAAQEGEASGGETETGTNPFDNGEGGGEAIVQVSSFHPNARFTFVSGVVDWTPDVPEVSDDVWDSYNTYQIRWLNTNQIVPLWVEQDATLGEYDEGLGYIPDDQDSNQPQLYEMDQEWELFDEGNDLAEVTFSTVPEEEEDQILENDDWWQDDDGGGTETPNGTETGTPTDSGS